MADTKTHLRELGVAVGISMLLKQEVCTTEDLTPNYFYKICSDVLDSSELVLIKSELEEENFTPSQLVILNNSFELARAIYKTFELKKTTQIVWCGANNHSESPIDLIIGELKFSLKEESFILENMGLYKYLTLMTGKVHNRGINIFEMFAKDVYQTFFNFVWNKFIQEKNNFSYTGSNYNSEAVFLRDCVQFKYNKAAMELVSTLPLEKDLPISRFNELTQSLTREKVFSKWIKKNLENDGQYLAIKRTVSEFAAASLVGYVKDNLDLDYSGLKRFLRVHKDEYYYAKSTNSGVNIYKVPSLNEFEHTFVIDDISYLVPKSQVNIITSIKNKTNNKILLLRNEVRFSHGQFNGVPEAKMYYDKNSSLETIYEKIF